MSACIRNTQIPRGDRVDAQVNVALCKSLDGRIYNNVQPSGGFRTSRCDSFSLGVGGVHTVRISFGYPFFEFESRLEVAVLVFITGPAVPERSCSFRGEGRNDAFE